MKSFAFAGLIAAAAALPQGPYDYSHTVSHLSSSTDVAVASTSTDDCTSSFPTIPADAVSSGIDYNWGTGSGSASGTGSELYRPTGTRHHHHSTGTSYAAATHTTHKDTTATHKGASATKSTYTAIPTSTPSSTSTSPSNTTSVSPSSDDDFLYGINVGNWLILEKWMDDGSVFTGSFSGASDQWTFDSISGSAAALEKHWSTWFTESDVEQIASYGFNALRIPIGYWAFDNSGTPYHTGAADYLDQAIGWAAKHGMRVLVDCHGSPGSQNGQDHSGHAGAIQWQQSDNLNKSTEILVTMAQRYGAANYSGVVWGIEMVNEPTADAPNDFSQSQSWAQSTYEAMMAVVENKALRIITHDSFMGPQKFTGVAQNIISRTKAASGADLASGQQTTFGVDQHDYQMYTDPDNALDQAGHIAEACGWAANLKTAQAMMPTIVGEWSSLTNICAKSDGSTVPSGKAGCQGASGCSCTADDPSQWSTQLVTAVRKYVEAQLDVFEANSDGYFLWSWKGPGGWGVTDTSKVGAFPTNVRTDRKYKGQCSSA